MLSFFILLDSVIFMIARLKGNKYNTCLILILLEASGDASNKSFQLISESDEFKFTSLFCSSDMNQFLFNSISSSTNTALNFDADSHSTIIDCGTSSTATSKKSDFIEGMCKPLTGVTISVIDSGLQASGIGPIMLHLFNGDDKAKGVQIERFLCLKSLSNILLSPHQILQQHCSLGSSCTA